MFGIWNKLKVLSRKLVSCKEPKVCELVPPVIPPRSSSLVVTSEVAVAAIMKQFCQVTPLFLRCGNLMFTVLKEIATGGTGTVHVAIFNGGDVPTDNRVIALKIFNKGAPRESFEREVEVYRALPAHRNIAEMVASGDPQNGTDVFYLALRYYAGLSLWHVLREDGPLELSQSLYWIKQVVVGLGWMHEHGWAHLDIKPENLLLVEDGLDSRIVLGDLGGCFRFSNLTPGGTLSYMAPEIMLRYVGKKGFAVPASDWFSVGMTFIQMLCMKTAFKIAGNAERLLLLLYGQNYSVVDLVQSGNHLAALFPESLEKFLRELCATDYEARPSPENVRLVVDRLNVEYPRGEPNRFDNPEEFSDMDASDSFASAPELSATQADQGTEVEEFYSAASNESDFFTAPSTVSAPVLSNTLVCETVGTGEAAADPSPVVNVPMMEVIPVIKRRGRLGRAAKKISKAAGKVKKVFGRRS